MHTRTMLSFMVFGLVATTHMHAHGSAAAYVQAPGADTEPKGWSAPPTGADFVIIGGGTAGCVIAARLCENLPEASVVLLERASPRTKREELLVRAPRLFFETWTSPGLTESWETEPNPGLLGRRVTQLTGRTLGGSSAINGAQWTKPPLATFDEEKWAFTGLDSVSAGQLFRRVEHKLQVSAPPPELQQTFLPEYLAAAAAAGLPTDPDPLSRTGPPSDGIWPNVLAVDHAGRRVDSCTAYLSPVLLKGGACTRNLQLIQSATVSKVVTKGGRAVAVRYLQANAEEGEQEREIEVWKEVVSSAGPYGSPKLLQASGIGPAEVLEGLGVPQVVELPVGESCVVRRHSMRCTMLPVFRPHCGVLRPAPVWARARSTVLDFYTAAPLAPEANNTAVNAPESIEAFNAGRRGSLAVAAGATNSVLATESGFSVFTNVVLPSLPENAIASTCGINPTARGTLRAMSADPRQLPVVDTNFLGTTADVRNAVACISRLNTVHNLLREPLGLLRVVPPPAADGSAVVTEEAVRNTTDHIYHYSSGSALGRVVDGEFQVAGVEGLRVVDASVLPELPLYAGPMATVYMLAELAAETITAAHE